MDDDALANPHFDLGNWYRSKRWPKLETLEGDLEGDFSALDLPWVLSIFEDCNLTNEEDDLPDLESVSDSDEEANHQPSNNEWTDNPDDDTVIDVSDEDTETDGQPYRPIGDILSETVARILDASDLYLGDSVFPQVPHIRFRAYIIDDNFI